MLFNIQPKFLFSSSSFAIRTTTVNHLQMPAPRLVSLKGSDFTGLGIECYGGLKDGIYVKKVAPQGPASGHINIGERLGLD